MPKNTGRGSRSAKAAEAASSGRIPAEAFAQRAASVGPRSGTRQEGGLFGVGRGKK
ncbi:hypothetical protein RhoFasK5_03358|nr:hypothetical protein A3Q40_03664 [Rhodococcus sp. PBTS 1]NIL82292.1 hypothetical protein [Rhodococcus kroppenstedtii]